jgi:beta-N-acetylhexosaminidase
MKIIKFICPMNIPLNPKIAALTALLLLSGTAAFFHLDGTPGKNSASIAGSFQKQIYGQSQNNGQEENTNATSSQSEQPIRSETSTLPQVQPQKNEGISQAEENLKNKIGQMLIIGFRGTKASENSDIAGQLKKLNVGGVVLFDYDNPSKSFPRNITSPAQTKQLITDLQSFSSTPLFIAVDAEGGLVNRLKAKYGFIDIPSAQTLGEQDDLAKTKQTASELGKELKDLGFNIDLAPVVDVNINPQNPIIGKMERSFSDDPEKVTGQALSFIGGLRENNIIPVLKHFPGHGSSQNDSHLGLVDVTKTYQQKELIPFQKIIEQDQADMVMTAHIMDTSIDPDYPATLSPLFLQNILRNKLGYQGVIFSDDMQMGAITKNYGFEDALVRSVNAGCDLIGLSNNNDSYDGNIASKAIDIIAKAVKDGRISEEKINASYERILELKKKFGIIK